MTVKELIEKLTSYDQDLEVRTMNISIEDDSSCPTFELKGVSSQKENNEDFEEPRDMDFVWLEFKDNSYIREEVNLDA